MSQRIEERGKKATTKLSIRKMVLLALFIALSAVGANIKVPSLIGTPAFDSLPGFFAAAVLGSKEGALIAALGHLLTALTAGFPLSLPIHLLITVEMGVSAFVFGYLFKKIHPIVAIIVAITLNGVVAPASFIPILGAGVFYTLLTPLLIASALNIIGAALLAKIPGLARVFKGEDHA